MTRGIYFRTEKNKNALKKAWIKRKEKGLGIAWNKGKKHLEYMMGKNNCNWKGGITSKNRLERESIEAKEWRKKIFERDNYTCQGCGEKGTYLHAHHLISWAHYPKYRYEEWNGQTACKPCHDNLHKELGYDR